MKENNSYSLDNTFMDSKSATTSNIDVNVVFVVNSSRILTKISCLAFSVSLVIWRDDYDLLS